MLSNIFILLIFPRHTWTQHGIVALNSDCCINTFYIFYLYRERFRGLQTFIIVLFYYYFSFIMLFDIMLLFIDFIYHVFDYMLLFVFDYFFILCYYYLYYFCIILCYNLFDFMLSKYTPWEFLSIWFFGGTRERSTGL